MECDTPRNWLDNGWMLLWWCMLNHNETGSNAMKCTMSAGMCYSTISSYSFFLLFSHHCFTSRSFITAVARWLMFPVSDCLPFLVHTYLIRQSSFVFVPALNLSPKIPYKIHAVETQFSTGWYRHILWLMTTGLHSTTSPSCTQDTFPHLRLVCIVAHLCVSSRIFAFLCIFAFSHIFAFLRIFAFSCIFAFLRIFTFHHASLCFIAHLRISSRIFAFHHASSRFTAHHRRSIHLLSSQFLGASHSIYYYIWLCLASYNYYFVMDPYFTSLTYLERSRFASKPWEGAYVRLRVAMSVFTT